MQKRLGLDIFSVAKLSFETNFKNIITGKKKSFLLFNV